MGVKEGVVEVAVEVREQEVLLAIHEMLSRLELITLECDSVQIHYADSLLRNDYNLVS